MDFFSQQDAARRKTGLLVGYFVLAVVLMIVALYAVAVAIAPLAVDSPDAAIDQIRWFRPDLLAVTTVVVGSIVGLGSAYKILELRGGGEQVASMVGGRRIYPGSTEPGERRLLNIVEEMAIAAGVPVPPVYVLDREGSINAFAAGYAPGDAVIGVSRGSLEYLSRDELQGVIAHEFSHILNGDMRLNIRLIGVLHGILLIAVIGYYVLRGGAYAGATRSRSRRDGNGGAYLLILGLALIIIGSIGLFFARLIKAAVSRQREYLADASAVQFTRNPDGIGGALKKIGGLSGGSKLQSPETETVSHMLFANGRGMSLLGLLATHPPLEERIRRIDPNFNGRYPQVQRLLPAEPVDVRAAGAPPAAARPRIGTPLGQTPIGKAIPLDPALLLAAIGALDQRQVNYAHQLLHALPDRLTEALHDPFSARCTVFAFLLEPEGEIRDEQVRLLSQLEGEASLRETLALEPLLHQQGRPARLPIIEIVQSTLVGLSPEQFQRFRQSVDRLVAADGKISLLEFVLQQVLIQRLARHILNDRPPAVKYHAVGGVRHEIAGLISCLAHLGSAQPAEAAGAFSRAVGSLFGPGQEVYLLPREECSMATVQQALTKLSQSSPAIKRRVLGAATACVAADGRVTVGEAELLRAIADALDCPLPPIVATASPQ